ncbi:polymorphic toxin-type HINT domain-containing protein [Kitasatospora sp. NPDC054939]
MGGQRDESGCLHGRAEGAEDPFGDEQRVQVLATLSFAEAKANAALLGPPGVGKTHIAVALAVASCRAGSGALTYQLRDPQNTSTLQIDAATKAVTRRAFDPYGAPRGPSPAAWSDNRGYLGKPLDAASGLNLLGARNYDASLGRFLSVDPVLIAGDPDQMGGYTYANNDPINQMDPDGLWPVPIPLPKLPSWNSVRSSVGKAVAGFVDEKIGWIHENNFYAAGNNTLAGVNGAIGKQTGVQVFPGITPMQASPTPMADFFGIPTNDPAYTVGRVTAVVASVFTGGVGIVQVAAKGIKAATAGVKNAGGIKNALTKLLPTKGSPKPGGGGRPTSGPQAPKTSPADPKAPATPTARPTSPAEPVGGSCSFTPDAPVLMADGSTKAISSIKSGDQVQAADQWTGTDKGGRKVTATWAHNDNNLVDLRLKAGGVTSTVKTTANHPFWDKTAHKWVPAGELVPGHSLTTDKGESVTVTAVRAVRGEARMYNLTVAELHTYYVLAGGVPILVHNSCGPDNTVTVYRAQTSHPDSQRLAVDDSGNVSISGDGYLYLNMSGDIRHSLGFRGGRSDIVAFDIPSDYANRITSSVAPQRKPRGWPGSPRDWNRYVSSSVQKSDEPGLYGIPGSMLDELEGMIIPGSGRIIAGGGS